MCMPTMPMLHCTQLPSGLRNHVRYAAGSSIAAAWSPGGEAASAPENGLLKTIAAIAAATRRLLEDIPRSFLLFRTDGLRAAGGRAGSKGRISPPAEPVVSSQVRRATGTRV